MKSTFLWSVFFFLNKKFLEFKPFKNELVYFNCMADRESTIDKGLITGGFQRFKLQFKERGEGGRREGGGEGKKSRKKQTDAQEVPKQVYNCLFLFSPCTSSNSIYTPSFQILKFG